MVTLLFTTLSNKTFQKFTSFSQIAVMKNLRRIKKRVDPLAKWEQFSFNKSTDSGRIYWTKPFFSWPNTPLWRWHLKCKLLFDISTNLNWEEGRGGWLYANVLRQNSRALKNKTCQMTFTICRAKIWKLNEHTSKEKIITKILRKHKNKKCFFFKVNGVFSIRESKLV